MYDAGNRKDVRRAEKAAARAERERIEWLRQALATIGGRSWFHNLLSECSLFSDPFTGDALKDNFIKGMRNIGLRMFSDIVSHCPDQYLLMMREAATKDINDVNGTRDPTTDTDSDRSFDPD